jgi:glucosylceramidase
MTRPFTRLYRILPLLGAATLLPAGLAVPAHAAGETVNIWLTTTDDQGGRDVVQGLAQQTPITFTAGTGNGDHTITVDENTTYQQFTGAGASFTDTAAWLLNSSGALSQETRDDTMRKLFDPNDGIGLAFLRNPMGASDLARYSYTYDDVGAGSSDPDLKNFSIDHDLADVLPLTKQAQQLNPDLKVMASPWSAPAWMKDNQDLDQGWLQSQYYQDGQGLYDFVANNLLPAFHAAGLTTKVLALDWNWDHYDSYASSEVDDDAVRGDSLFGGIAWHGYSGDVGEQSAIRDQYPDTDAYDTEHSGGTWIGNQQAEDMANIVDYTRNRGKSVVKWSLAVDQNMGPHNGAAAAPAPAAGSRSDRLERRLRRAQRRMEEL